MNMLVSALKYHDDGFTVIPCRLENTATPGKVNKVPLVAWQKFQKERPSRSLIEYWFSEKYPSAHVGAVPGEHSRMFVMDLDVGYGEADVLKLRLPKNTLIAKTPSGGFHLYYKHPGGVHIKTKAGILPRIDVRGDGGFIVLPPSTYPDGRKYEWINHSPIAEASPETLKFVTEAAGEHRRGGDQDWKTMLEGSGPGGRTDTAIAVAGALLRFQPEKQWKTLCWELVRLANKENDPPLDELLLAKNFHGIMMRERQRRRLTGTW